MPCLMASSPCLHRGVPPIRSLIAPVRITAMNPMSPADRRKLKALAHPLKPVVMIGNDGLTPGVLAEIERALKSHELIKIRVHGDDREARSDWLARICEFTAASPVQHLGKLLIVFRSNPELHVEPSPPRATRKPAERPKRADPRRNKGWTAPGTEARAQRSATTRTRFGHNADGDGQRPPRPTTRSRNAGSPSERSFSNDSPPRRTTRRRPG